MTESRHSVACAAESAKTPLLAYDALSSTAFVMWSTGSLYAANVASAENDEVREMSSPVTCCDAACPLFGLLFHDSSANCCR